MVKILSTVKNAVTDKQGSFSLVDASFVALTKSVVLDGVVFPVVDKYNPLGKNIAINLLGKVLGATLAVKYLPKKFNSNAIVATSMMVSAGDDVVQYGLAKFGGRKPAEASDATGETFIGGNDSFGGSNKTNGSGEVFI